MGHATDKMARTGCTVILLPSGSKASVDVRGAAPGTRETDLLSPENSVEEIHAIMLCGGSAFGLDAASGAMQFLDEKGIGIITANGIKVPIVPAAVIYDLNVVASDKRPDKEMGYEACRHASDKPVEQGLVGAGTGATVGKILGIKNVMNGGVGSHCTELPDGTKVCSLAVVNAFGDVVDPQTGKIVAGARDKNGDFINTIDSITKHSPEKFLSGTNTTLAVIATNAALTKTQLKKLAQMSHDGLAWVVRPVHTMYDGDVVFTVSSPSQCNEKLTTDLSVLGVAACKALSQSILRAVEMSNKVPDHVAIS